MNYETVPRDLNVVLVPLYRLSSLFFDLLIYATKRNCLGRWTVPPTGHKKGIGAASAARAETLLMPWVRGCNKQFTST